MSYYVFIVSSRNDPVYEAFDTIRRKQMKELGVQYKFLLNGALPPGYSLKDDEEYFEDASFTPGMFLKFFHALGSLEGTFDFILRLNSSTFVDFSKVGYLLETLPKEKCRAGYTLSCDYNTTKLFVAGTAMIFSKDVITHLQSISLEDSIISDIISLAPDDWALSILTDEYCDSIITSINDAFVLFQQDRLDFSCIKNSTIFFRVKNTDRITNDIIVWETLYDRLKTN